VVIIIRLRCRDALEEFRLLADGGKSEIGKARVRRDVGIAWKDT
jgi:hypothetical protein